MKRASKGRFAARNSSCVDRAATLPLNDQKRTSSVESRRRKISERTKHDAIHKFLLRDQRMRQKCGKNYSRCSAGAALKTAVRRRPHSRSENKVCNTCTSVQACTIHSVFRQGTSEFCLSRKGRLIPGASETGERPGSTSSQHHTVSLHPATTHVRCCENKRELRLLCSSRSSRRSTRSNRNLS